MKTWNSAEAEIRLGEISAQEYRPSISELLDELDEIKKHEPADSEIPERRDRLLR
jgi:hypothetical protein